MGAHRSNLSYRNAAAYDIIHTPGTAWEVDGLERIARLFDKSRGRFRVLEPACGSGRYLRVLGRRGVACLGYDLEPLMIEYAKGRVERAGLKKLVDIKLASMTDCLGVAYPERSFSMAFNLINTVRHLDDDASMLEHLAQTARGLKLGGFYALGISTSAYGLEMASEDVYSAARGGLRVTQTLQYLPPEDPDDRTERVVSHSTLSTSSGQTHIDASYGLRTYTHEQLHTLFGASAMRLDSVVNEVGEEIDAPLCGYAIYILRPE